MVRTARSLLLVALATGCLAQSPPSSNPYSSAADAEAGRILFRNNCAVCHGMDGSGGRGSDLTQGRFRHGSSDEQLFRNIVNGIPGTEMPPVSIEGRQTWQLIAFIRSLSAPKSRAGAADPARGRLFFEGKGGCLECHMVGTRGARLGPDLSGIGISNPRSSLEASILKPNDRVLSKYWTARATSRGGRVTTGIRLNEDTHSIQLLDSNENLVSLLKVELENLEIIKTSSMPSYEGKLTASELDDLIAYLSTLRN